MKILFLPGSRDAPSARFRLWQFVGPLRERGYEVHVRVIFPNRYWTVPVKLRWLRRGMHIVIGGIRVVSAAWATRGARRFDAIIMNRDLIPEVGVRFLELWAVKRNPNVIFDFDDAIFLGPRRRKLEEILPHFQLVTVGNAYLAEYARKHARRVAIWPTVVDTDRWIPRSSRADGPFRLGWSGSRSTMTHCLPVLAPVMSELARQVEFEFVIVSDEPPDFIWPGVNVRFVRWTPATEVASLHLMDVGLMPLKDDPFQRGKCGAKAITYMSVGIPSVVSPVGVNAEIVTHGVTGFHCDAPDEWVSTILLLIHDPARRCRIGEAARKAVIERYSVRSMLPRMEAAIRRQATLCNAL